MSNNKKVKLEEQIINRFVKLIGKDMIKYLPSKIIPSMIGVISIPVFTNLFPPDEYGIYSMVISGILLTSNILTGWLANSAFRFYDEYKNKNKETTYFTTIFTTLFIINSAVVILGVISFTLFNNFFYEYKFIFLFSLLILISAPFMKLTKKILRANRDINIYSFLTILLPIGKLGLVLLFNQYVSFLGVSMLLIATFLTETIIVLIALKRLKPDLKISYFNKNFFVKLFKYGFPLMFTSILIWVLSVSDRYIIGFLRSSEEVGLYSIAYTIGKKSLYLVFMMLMLAAYPVIIKAWNNHDKEYVELLLNKLIKYFYILTIPTLTALFVLSPMLMSILSSPEYYEGYRVIPWVSLGLFFMSLSQYVFKIWELKENTKIIMYTNLIAAVINLLLNLLLVNKFGYIAAGISTFVSYFIYCMIAINLTKDEINLSLLNSDTYKIVLSALLMLIPVYIMNRILEYKIFSFILIVFSGAVFYFILLYIFGVIKKEAIILIDAIRG